MAYLIINRYKLSQGLYVRSLPRKILLFVFLLVAVFLTVKRNFLDDDIKKWFMSSEKKVQNRYVALSVGSQFSMRDSYMFYIPVTCLAWRRLGFEPIVIMVQPEHRPSQSYPSVSENTTRLVEELKSNLLKLKVIEYLNHLNVKVVYMNAPDKLVPFVGMLSRMFTAQLVDEYIQNDEDFIMMSDTDLIPVKKDYYSFDAQSKAIKIWSAYCCGEFEYLNYNYTMYSMLNLGMSKKQWIELFELYDASVRKYVPLKDEAIDLPISNSELKSDDIQSKISFKISDIYNSSLIISKVLDMFGKDYLNVNLERGNDLWYTDQKMVSILIEKYRHFAQIGIDKKLHQGWRLDRSQDSKSWYETVEKDSLFNTVLDSHLYGDDIFDDLNLLKVLNKRLFDEPVLEFIDKYVEEYSAIMYRFKKQSVKNSSLKL